MIPRKFPSPKLEFHGNRTAVKILISRDTTNHHHRRAICRCLAKAVEACLTISNSSSSPYPHMSRIKARRIRSQRKVLFLPNATIEKNYGYSFYIGRKRIPVCIGTLLGSVQHLRIQWLFLTIWYHLLAHIIVVTQFINIRSKHSLALISQSY